MSSAESSEVSAQPSTATLPSRVSRPTATRPEFSGRGLDQRRIAHRGGADDDAGDTLGEPACDGRAVANAAAELQRNFDRRENALHRRRIHRPAGKGAVEIDDVEIVEALGGKPARLLGRIAMKHGRARHVALLEADREAVLEIDGGKKDHGFQFKKFAIKARPSRWLFSGWNCVPTMLSRATMAVTGPP